MKKGRVLVVDDDARNVEIVLHLLEDLAELATAASGEEALAQCERFPPDLVLLDIMMPGIDGYETCTQLKQRHPQVKVILVSAKAMLEERLQGYTVGADDYIAKPFDHEEFLAKVRVFLKLRATEEALVTLNGHLEESVQARTAQLQKAERDAQAARVHLDNIIRSMADPLFELDTSLKVRRVNPAAAELLGRSAESLVGAPFRSLVRDGEWPAEEDLRGVLTAAAIESRDVELRGGADESVPVFLSLSPMKDDHGAIDGLVGVAKDMREKKRAEAEREVLQRQVLQASKLASIGEIAAGVAHEINNPLTVIKGNLDYFHDWFEARGERELLQVLRQQETAIERIVNIVNGLRLYARRDDDAAAPLDLHHLIDQSVSMVQQIFTKQGAELETRLGAPTPFVSGNAGRFQQVLMNLLTNAKDALEGRPNGRIVIETEGAEGKVLVKVSDNGCGVPADVRARLFEAFFTTKEAGKGTGLGLSIAQSLVKEMHGTIEITSEPGQGSVFTLTFPQLDAQHLLAPEAIAIPAAERPTRFSGRALIVDDEDAIGQLLRRYLTEFGFDVDTAHDGAEAYEKIGTSRYDLLVTDIKMPRMNGDTLIGEGRKAGRLGDTKIVAVTGSTGVGEDTARLDRLASLVDAMVRKPFSKSEVYLVLKELLPS